MKGQRRGERCPRACHHFVARWTAMTEPDGLAGMEVIESSTLSLVVLDLSLPGLGGLDILNR
jgi:DNA-binding response OmpR family regulator